MNYEISKEFDKQARKLSGKYKTALQEVIKEIIAANAVKDISDCKKLTDYENIYRIRMGSYRIFFYLELIDHVIFLKYLVNRGEAYSKEYLQKLKQEEKNRF